MMYQMYHVWKQNCFTSYLIYLVKMNVQEKLYKNKDNAIFKDSQSTFLWWPIFGNNLAEIWIICFWWVKSVKWVFCCCFIWDIHFLYWSFRLQRQSQINTRPEWCRLEDFSRNFGGIHFYFLFDIFFPFFRGLNFASTVWINFEVNLTLNNSCSHHDLGIFLLTSVK